MEKTYTARTETTYEVLTNHGQTIRVVHEPDSKTATLYFVYANGEVYAEMDFEVGWHGLARSLSEIFNDIDGKQLDSGNY